MKGNLQKFGEVATFVFLGILFLLTGYASWGLGTPEIPKWLMPAVSVTALGWGLHLLYASLVEFNGIRSAEKGHTQVIGR